MKISRLTIATLALFLLMASCARDEDEATSTGSVTATQPQQQQPEPTGPIVIKSISPAKAKVGVGFQVQKNGQSAFGFTTENATRKAVVMLDGKPLVSAYGNPTFVTALVPDDLIKSAGTHEVYVQDGSRQSNKISFVVEP